MAAVAFDAHLAVVGVEHPGRRKTRVQVVDRLPADGVVAVDRPARDLVFADRVDVVEVKRERARHLVRAADVEMLRPRLHEVRRRQAHDPAGERRVDERVADRFPVRRIERRRPRARRERQEVEGRPDVRPPLVQRDVLEDLVVVDPVAAADDALAVTPDVPREAEPRPEVVQIVLALVAVAELPEVGEDRRLEVVAVGTHLLFPPHPEVQRQVAGRVIVVLEVHADVGPVVVRDVRPGRAGERVRDRVQIRVEAARQRLVEVEEPVQRRDEEPAVVRPHQFAAYLEIVVAAPALFPEREVVLELPPLLDRFLRGVQVRAEEEVGRLDARLGVVVGGDVVVEVLKQDQRLVDLVAAEHGRVLRDHGVDDVRVQRASGLERGAADEVVLALVVLARVADDHRVGVVEAEVRLRREEVIPERRELRALLVGKHAVGVDRLVILPPVELVGHEEVRHVLPERPAEGGARLLLRERLLADVLLLLEVGLRVQGRVAREQERAAVRIVAAALRDHVDDAAGRAPELRAVASGRDLVLLDRVLAELLQQPADDAVVVVAAVDGDVDGAAGHAAVADATDLRLRRVVVVRRPRAGNEQREVLELAAAERHVLHQRGVDHLADVRPRRLHQR